MKIQYCSDLHLEFGQNSSYLEEFPLSVSGEILVLAGDIVPLHNEYLSNSFFQFASERYEQVFWVPGNHEFYYKDIATYENSIDISIRRNIHLLHNVQKEYKGVRLIFSTLWSKINDFNIQVVEKGVADYECISFGKNKLRSSDSNRLHEISLEFLRDAFTGRTMQKTVVVTHHLPSAMCNAPQHKNSPVNDAFCTDLTPLIESSKANFWLYGHSHFNQNPVYTGSTILITNQLGYVQMSEHGTFRHNAYFAI